MGGFGGILSALITPATNADAAYTQGKMGAEAAATARQQQSFLNALNVLREQKSDAEQSQLRQAQIGHLTAQQQALTNPPARPQGAKWDPVNRVFVNADDQTVAAPENQPPAKPTAPVMGTPKWLKAQTDLARVRRDFAPPQAPFIQAIPDAQGNIKIVTQPKTPGAQPTVTTPGVNKGVGGGAGSMSLTPQDRAKMLAQAQLDNETMKQIEDKWLAEGKVPGVGAGVAGGLSALHGGATAQVLSPIGNKMTGVIDPDYQRYLTAQRSYGRVMGNLQSKRYSDVQAEIERSISGVAASDLPATIAYKRQLRDTSLNDPSIQPPAPSGGGRSGGKPMSPTAYQNARKAGYTDAEIQAQGYVIPQGGEE